eukprot:jgi/Botrbrau1/16302/Bobra.0066s0071.1
MLPASSPPAMAARDKKDDEWSLVSQQAHEDSPGLSGDEPSGSEVEEEPLRTATMSEGRSPGSSSGSRLDDILYGTTKELRSASTVREYLAPESQKLSGIPSHQSCPATTDYRQACRKWILDSGRYDDPQTSMEDECMPDLVLVPPCSPEDGEDEEDVDEDVDDDGLDESVSQAWVQTQLLAADIRESSSFGVPDVKAPAVERYMKIVVAGQPSLGKTTFVNNIRASFAQMETSDPSGSLVSHPSVLTAFNGQMYEVRRQDDKGNNFHYFLQDTKGFTSLEEALPVLEAIQVQSESYFKTEQDGKRTQPMAMLMDPRVDLCLYFLPPHAIHPLDVEIMGRISQLVPVVPIISKADSLTVSELQQYREQILCKLASNGVAIHSFEHADAVAAGFSHIHHIFAVVASSEYDVIISRSWPIRQYPWGSVEVLNRAHSDVPALKNLVFALGYENLKLNTETRYLAYRQARLEGKPPPVAHMAVCRSISREPSFKPRLSSAPKPAITVREVLCLIFVAFAFGVFVASFAYQLDRAQEVVQTREAVGAVPDWAAKFLETLKQDAGGSGPSMLSKSGLPKSAYVGDGVLLTMEEYHANLQLLTGLLKGPKRFEDWRPVLQNIKMLEAARSNVSRLILPEVPECPAYDITLVAANVTTAASHMAQSIVKNVQTQLHRVGPLSDKLGKDVSQGMSRVGREVTQGMSLVRRDVSKSLSKLNREAKSGAEKLLEAVVPLVTSSLTSVGEKVSAAVQHARPGINDMQRTVASKLRMPSTDQIATWLRDAGNATASTLQKHEGTTRLLRRISIIFAFL